MSGLNCISNGVQPFRLPSGKTLQVDLCSILLEKWTGAPIQDNYGGKEVIRLNGEPLFAELAVLRLLGKEGWQGVWVDTYRGKFRKGLPEKEAPCDLPEPYQGLYERIFQANGGRSGFFDLFIWQDEEVQFVELKRRKKDKIQPQQVKWLEAALSCGIPLHSFLIVEWDVK